MTQRLILDFTKSPNEATAKALFLYRKLDSTLAQQLLYQITTPSEQIYHFYLLGLASKGNRDVGDAIATARRGGYSNATDYEDILAVLAAARGDAQRALKRAASIVRGPIDAQGMRELARNIARAGEGLTREDVAKYEHSYAQIKHLVRRKTRVENFLKDLSSEVEKSVAPPVASSKTKKSVQTQKSPLSKHTINKEFDDLFPLSPPPPSPVDVPKNESGGLNFQNLIKTDNNTTITTPISHVDEPKNDFEGLSTEILTQTKNDTTTATIAPHVEEPKNNFEEFSTKILTKTDNKITPTPAPHVEENRNDFEQLSTKLLATTENSTRLSKHTYNMKIMELWVARQRQKRKKPSETSALNLLQVLENVDLAGVRHFFKVLDWFGLGPTDQMYTHLILRAVNIPSEMKQTWLNDMQDSNQKVWHKILADITKMGEHREVVQFMNKMKNEALVDEKTYSKILQNMRTNANDTKTNFHFWLEQIAQNKVAISTDLRLDVLKFAIQIGDVEVFGKWLEEWENIPLLTLQDFEKMAQHANVEEVLKKKILEKIHSGKVYSSIEKEENEGGKVKEIKGKEDMKEDVKEIGEEENQEEDENNNENEKIYETHVKKELNW